MRRLPETDLANSAALPFSERHGALRRVNLNNPTVHYRPTRRRFPDIFNGRGDLIAEARDVDLETIKESVRRDPSNRNAATEKANLEIVESLHQWAVANKVRARRYPIAPFRLTGAVGITLSYCSSSIIIKGGRPHVLFFDPRRANGLTPEGRLFTFSMMHHLARGGAYPDLDSAELLIFQFPMNEEETGRQLEVHKASGLTDALFDYDEVELRVRETYDTWAVVLAQRAEELRRRADRDRGTFGLSA